MLERDYTPLQDPLNKESAVEPGAFKLIPFKLGPYTAQELDSLSSAQTI